jgi:simple sugar transport system substrate-binding protein
MLFTKFRGIRRPVCMSTVCPCKTKIPFFVLILCILAAASCRKTEKVSRQAEDQGIILGFSQIGAESAWRNCNTRSVQEAAAEAGIQLLFSNAEQKQENQIKAIRSFIAYQVDVIAFVPIIADGWDNVLQEAKDAGIPVLVTDRKINIQDESLYAGFIGTDSLWEGREAAKFLLKKFKNRPASAPPIRIVELSGTVGSSPATGRARGFREVLEPYPQFQIVYSESGDFLRSKGYELMQAILRTRPGIDVIFSHNDGMTLGALDAIRERGLKPGTDIVIVTIDAEQAAIDALDRGEVNCVVECNPKQGPYIMRLAKQLARGDPIARLLHVDEAVFYEGEDLSALPPRGY